MKTCIVCGKEFEPRTRSQNTCSPECANARRMSLNRDWNARARARRRAEKAEKERSKSGRRTLAEISAEARNIGMSYGKYVAWLKFQRLHSCGWCRAVRGVMAKREVKAGEIPLFCLLGAVFAIWI